MLHSPPIRYHFIKEYIMDKVGKVLKVALQCILFCGSMIFAAHYGVVGVLLLCVVIGAYIAIG